MALHKRQKQRIWLLIAFVILTYSASFYKPEQSSQQSAEEIYEQQQNNTQLEITGKITHILEDGLKGSRNQRFIVELRDGHTILVARNIDMIPNIAFLQVGDEVSVFGEYEWNDKGGVLHLTDHNPDNNYHSG